MAGGKKKKAGPSASATTDASKAGATAAPPGKAGGAGKGAKTVSPAGAKSKGAGAAAAEGVSLEELFAKLAAHTAKNEYSKAIKAADEILQASPGDLDALRCKAVALIQQSKVKEALACIDGAPKQAASAANGAGEDSAANHLAFEKAYCFYRQNRLAEAMEVLQSAEKTPGVLQLEGQVLYRMGDTEKCIERFEELIRKHRSEAASNEVKTNVIAAYVMGGRAAEVKALLETHLKVAPKDGFDIAYNTACSLIELRDFAAAEQMLLLARRVGQEILIDEELTAQEIEEELAPITVQLAYVHQVSGRRLEAQEGYNTFLKRKPLDLLSLAVAVNNLTALRNTKDTADSLRRLDRLVDLRQGGGGTEGGGALFPDGLDLKLSPLQKAVLLHNRFLLLLLAGKLQEAGEMLPLLDGLLARCPSQLLPLHASLLSREGRSSADISSALSALVSKLGSAAAQASPSGAAGASLPPLTSGFGTDGLARGQEGGGGEGSPSLGPSDTTHLLTAQAAVAEGRLADAAESLAHIGAARFQPSLVASVVDLKERVGDMEGAEAVMDAAVAWWEGKAADPESASALQLILDAAARLKRRNGKPEAAALIFRKLASQGGSAERQAEAQASLVLCSAAFDPAAADKMAQELPSLGPALDAEELERQGAAALPTRLAKRAAAEEAPAEKQRPKKKSKRKLVLPKGFDPANPGPAPDPERWLPRRERSSFKPKKKDKKKIDVRGAQGAVVREKPEGAGPEGAPAAGKPGSGADKGGKGKSASDAKGAGKGPAASEATPAKADAKKKGGKKGRR